MTRTTPPRPIDVEAHFPELRAWRREAVRLHPRPGKPEVGDDSMGGPLLWPAEEPWPVCAGEHEDMGDGYPEEGEPLLVPIVQIRREAAPGVPFPEGRDLLQVLWCPFDHDNGFYCPEPRVFWRTAAEVGEVRPTPPAPAGAPDRYVPVPCVLHPEAVADYGLQELDPGLCAELSERHGAVAAEAADHLDELVQVPGTKLGGWPGWVQGPQWPACAGCGQTAEHLLTVASWEFSPGSERLWLPLEDPEPPAGDDGFPPAMDPAGLMLGDAGSLQVFECRTCPGRPGAFGFDCS
ncbi:DUF1963 domain-containing protein [Nocardiopsis protaetiae]|uniref:DUF1963 domain-containing protein n=1 Tax=Nocardiopsis protaetiae TaxID=3382270 RepID=UPI00387AD198